MCKNILHGFEKKKDDESLHKLIDIILAYECPVADISSDRLMEDLQAEEVRVNHEEAEEHTPLDYRIKNISFKNFRTFPNIEGRKPYGLALSRKDEEPCSVFLVGKNGTGKSTIFDALEMLYAGKVKNAEDRGIRDDDKLHEYLTYGFGDIPAIAKGEAMLKIEMKDESIMGHDWINIKDIPVLCVPALCCSDMDIEEISKLDDEEKTRKLPKMEGEEEIQDLSESDFQKYIRNQLGYNDLTVIRDLLIKTCESIAKRFISAKGRLALAELTSGDMESVQQTFCKMVESSKPTWNEWNKEVGRFVTRDEISKIKEAENPDDFINNDYCLFGDYWKELINNIKNRQQLDYQPVGEGGFVLEEEQKNARVGDLDKIIDGIVLKLNAMYQRLKKALDTYITEKDDGGLSTAIVSMAKDYDTLVNSVHKLPIRDREIRAMMAKSRKDFNALIILISELNETLDSIFGKLPTEEKPEESLENLGKFVEHILNDYHDVKEIFTVKTTANSFEVKIHVTDEEGNYFETVPRKYLNTFRYRLYAVLLKISLAFYYMKTNHCVAPIIIDDVFNASDFENSISLSSFVLHIIDIYQDVIGGDIPLQLIILTHDEMIASAFKKGMSMKSQKMMEREQKGAPAQDEYCIYGRLFPYKEAEKIEEKVKRGGNFLNLYLPN